jgi:hypothetical protein
LSSAIAPIPISFLLLCGQQKSQNPPRVKYWEIIADNLSKAGWSWAAFQPLILADEQSSLLTRIAGKISDSSCVRMKS